MKVSVVPQQSLLLSIFTLLWVANKNRSYTGKDTSVVFGIAVYKEGQSEALEVYINLADKGTMFLQNIEKGNY